MIPGGAPILTTAAMRAVEEAAFASGVSQDELMERAGLGVAAQVHRFAGRRPVLVLAGPGNNGGDAYVAARHLAEWGHDVLVAALGEAGEGAARRMARRWFGATVPLSEAGARPVLVDGLFGTGVSRALGDSVAARLRDLADGAFVIAIDVPSGMASDAGGGVRSPIVPDVTVALGALKPAHVVGEGACGQVMLVDLGIPIDTRWRSIARPVLAAPGAGANKFTRGMVLVVAGAMQGAAALAASAALHGGAGYIVLAEERAGSGAPHALVRRAVPGVADLEKLLADERIGRVLVGPGFGRDRRARDLLDAVLASGHDLVIDGDALSLLGRGVARRVATARRRVTLTPHSGEFDRMFGGSGNKIDRTLAAATETGAMIVHKGHDTVIAGADGGVVVSSGASAWLSTAGTGDVLAGLVAARLAGGGDEAEAVWLHGRAAAMAGPAFVADDLISRIPRAMAECTWT